MKNFDLYWILLFGLSSCYFFAPTAIDIQIFKLIYWVVLLITFLISLPLLIKSGKTLIYGPKVKIIIISIFISFIPAYLFWDQTFDLSLRVATSTLWIVFYFYLVRKNIDLHIVEKAVWIITIMYVICYLYALSQAPRLVFGLQDTTFSSRGVYRLDIPGRGFLYLSFFMAITKYVEIKSKKWIAISTILFILIVMHVSRQHIVFSFIVAFFYVGYNVKNWKKIAILGLIWFLTVFVLPQITVVNNLLELTETQIESNNDEENVRIGAYKHFFFNFSPNLIAVLIGNGPPHLGEESSYGAKYLKLIESKGYIMSDVGFASVYVQFGILALFSYCVIFYKSFKQKTEKKFAYARLYMIYIMLSSILSASFLSLWQGAAFCICLYVLEFSNKQQRELKEKYVNVHLN